MTALTVNASAAMDIHFVAPANPFAHFKEIADPMKKKKHEPAGEDVLSDPVKYNHWHRTSAHMLTRIKEQTKNGVDPNKPTPGQEIIAPPPTPPEILEEIKRMKADRAKSRSDRGGRRRGGGRGRGRGGRGRRGGGRGGRGGGRGRGFSRGRGGGRGGSSRRGGFAGALAGYGRGGHFAYNNRAVWRGGVGVQTAGIPTLTQFPASYATTPQVAQAYAAAASRYHPYQQLATASAYPNPAAAAKLASGQQVASYDGTTYILPVLQNARAYAAYPNALAQPKR